MPRDADTNDHAAVRTRVSGMSKETGKKFTIFLESSILDIVDVGFLERNGYRCVVVNTGSALSEWTEIVGDELAVFITSSSHTVPQLFTRGSVLVLHGPSAMKVPAMDVAEIVAQQISCRILQPAKLGVKDRLSDS
jgi:hypothetical protein